MSHPFRPVLRRLVLPAAALGLVLALVLSDTAPTLLQRAAEAERFEEARKVPRRERQAARTEHFHRMLRDPQTDRIPAGARHRELALARTLPRAAAAGKRGTAVAWTEAGPFNIGGRTRALAVDVTDPDVVVAGGVTGGIFKSVDGGRTWTPRTDLTENLSVTSVAQDPRPGQTNVWYYTAGESAGTGGSPFDPESSGGGFLGAGLFKSTDGGDTWTRVISSGEVPQLDHPFDQTSRVVVHPQTGDVYVASNLFGVVRSQDGGASFELFVGGPNHHRWSDVAVAADGRVLVALGDGFDGVPGEPCVSGVYVLEDPAAAGGSCDALTPLAVPLPHVRGVLAAAPSDAGAAYLFATTGFCDEVDDEGECVKEDVRFVALDLDAGTFDDRSDNLPDVLFYEGEEDEFALTVKTQDAYDMALAVKPDDPAFVVLGGVNLFRSADAFATPVDDPGAFDDFWLGGYLHPSISALYPGQHPDQHTLVFDPHDPNRLWSGHDGGVSMLPDVTAPQDFDAFESSLDFSTLLPWELRNDRYNVTQFYTIAIDDEAGDAKIMGGTQDNGTPFFALTDITQGGPNPDVSSGDGSFAYFGDDFAYVSTQNGNIDRVPYDDAGGLPPFDSIFRADEIAQRALIVPPDVTGQLFINPFAVDPSDEDVLYYPSGATLWRQEALGDIPAGAGITDEPSADGWVPLDALELPDGYSYSALAVSREAPAHRLYLAASSYTDAPRFFRLDDAASAEDGAVEISIPDATPGVWVNAVAVNPADGDEALVVMANYGIVGLYHTADGGATWAAVEGNLQGGVENLGPSIRAAAVVPSADGPRYYVGTSVGLFSSDALDGMATTWAQEGPDVMGNVIVEALAARASDGTVAAGTHGRGAFFGRPVSGVATERDALPRVLVLEGNHPNPFNPATVIRYRLGAPSRVRVQVYDAAGRLVRTLGADAPQGAGPHRLRFDASGLASGLYLYRVDAVPVGGGEAARSTGRMMLVR